MKQVRVTIFGASGRIGRLVVQEALRRGYDVVAFVHSDAGFKPSKRLQVVQGDIHDETAVAAALAGSSVVVSALGSWGTPSKDIVSSGMRSIIPAMETQDIKRIVTLTGAESRASGDRLSIIHKVMRTLLRTAAGRVLADGEEHIRLLEASRLDWTVIRSPIMTPREVRGRYELGRKRPAPWALVSRHAVALSLIDQVEDTEWYKKAPFIS